MEYEYVEKLPEDLTCSICLKVLCQPNFMNCCEQQFCHSCLEKWWVKSRSCPHCRSTEFQNVLMKQKTRRVGELKVYCPNKKYGCQTILKMRECADHLSATNDEGCLYVHVQCPIGCTNVVFRGELKNHIQTLCPQRQVECMHCLLEGEHEFITGEHVDTCPSYPLPCPLHCGDSVLRKDLHIHKDTCPLKIVPCPYRELGCEVKVCRRDLEEHVESSALQHMTQLAKSHLALKTENAVKEVELASLKAENTTLRKQFTDLSARFSAVGKLAKIMSREVQPQQVKPQQVLNQPGLQQPRHYYDPFCLSSPTGLLPQPESWQQSHLMPPQQSLNQEDIQKSFQVLSENFAKMYPLLTDTSVIILGQPLTLRLSETNKKCGYHYLEVEKYKLKLEWGEEEKHSAYRRASSGSTTLMKLFVVRDDSSPLPINTWSYLITIKSRNPLGHESLETISSEKQRVEATQEASKDQSLQLLNKANCRQDVYKIHIETKLLPKKRWKTQTRSQTFLKGSTK